MSTKAAQDSKRTARIVGVLFILATAAGVLSVVLLGSMLEGPDFLMEVSANDNKVALAALVELIMAAAIGGIAVMLYATLARQSKTLAIGYVVARVLEAAPVIVAAVILLSLLTLSREYAQAGAPDAAPLRIAGTLLLAAREWADLVGTQIFFSLTALILNCSLYQSKLVPRFLSVWGLIGAMLILAAGLLAMFGLAGPFSTISIMLYLPIALQEMVFAVWLIVKGFSSPATDSPSAE